MARATRRSVVVVGTRGSRLALIQTELVLDRLRAVDGGVDFQIEKITTSGDASSTAPRGEGVFVKEIQRALLRGKIDLAVHSLKDLPTEGVPGLAVAGIPEREDPREALVGRKLALLPAGARLGTSSPRRAAQIRRLRADVVVVSTRGNVPTRIRRVKDGELDSVVLALAGLRRLGYEADEIFEPEAILPAPGQGALAVEIREDDERLRELGSAIDHAPTRSAVTAERAVLRELGGGCMLPVATIATVDGSRLYLKAAVVSSDGSKEARAEMSGESSEPIEVAGGVAQKLRDLGALDLLLEVDEVSEDG